MEISLSDRVIRCAVCGYEDDRDINSARNMLEIALDRVDEGWLTLTEKEIELIERLFRNIKRYINLSGIDSKLYPTVGLTGS